MEIFTQIGLWLKLIGFASLAIFVVRLMAQIIILARECVVTYKALLEVKKLVRESKKEGSALLPEGSSLNSLTTTLKIGVSSCPHSRWIQKGQYLYTVSDLQSFVRRPRKTAFLKLIFDPILISSALVSIAAFSVLSHRRG